MAPTELAALRNQLSAFHLHTAQANHEDTHDSAAAASSFPSSVPCPRSGRNILRFRASLVPSGAPNGNPSLAAKGVGFSRFSWWGCPPLDLRRGRHPRGMRCAARVCERGERGRGGPEAEAEPAGPAWRRSPAPGGRVPSRCCSRGGPALPGRARTVFWGRGAGLGGGEGAGDSQIRWGGPRGAFPSPRHRHARVCSSGNILAAKLPPQPPPRRLPRYPTSRPLPLSPQCDYELPRGKGTPQCGAPSVLCHPPPWRNDSSCHPPQNSSW